MEIAWEVLESARIAYEKSGDHLLELSDVYNALYELSAENGMCSTIAIFLLIIIPRTRRYSRSTKVCGLT